MKNKIAKTAEEQIPEEQSPEKRITNFDEVCLGYTKQQSHEEAKRCLQCPVPMCEKSCPAQVPIKRFISHIAESDHDSALSAILEKNCLPGICGRVCPSEQQCRKTCIHYQKISIALLERSAADYSSPRLSKKKSLSKSIAVIGSGPSGLSCAYDLALKGFKVTIYEALHEPGGVLTYGIPEFRLPKSVVKKEISALKDLGVETSLNTVIGLSITLEELKKIHDAVFIASGAGLPYFLGIPGEGLNNVYSANEFLSRNVLMKAHKFPEYRTPVGRSEKTIVIGGGNVAIDAARTARRLGSQVTVFYRRTKNEMPARPYEIKHAEEEGIKFEFLASPLKLIGEATVRAGEFIKMRLSSPDASGRASSVEIPG